MYDSYKNSLQLCSWFRFLLVLSSQPSSSKQGVYQAPSGCCTGEARTNPPNENNSFLFFCRSEMYSYHRNNIATTRHMQGKLATVLMQHFFFSLNVPERMRQGFDWSVTFSIKRLFKNLWFVLFKNNLLLSQIHFNGGSLVAGLGNKRGRGFVFLKHYHCHCICWLDYVASYPSQTCSVSISFIPLILS